MQPSANLYKSYKSYRSHFSAPTLCIAQSALPASGNALCSFVKAMHMEHGGNLTFPPCPPFVPRVRVCTGKFCPRYRLCARLRCATPWQAMCHASQQTTQPCAIKIQKHMALTAPCAPPPYSSVPVRTSPFYTAHTLCIAPCALPASGNALCSFVKAMHMEHGGNLTFPPVPPFRPACCIEACGTQCGFFTIRGARPTACGDGAA